MGDGQLTVSQFLQKRKLVIQQLQLPQKAFTGFYFYVYFFVYFGFVTFPLEVFFSDFTESENIGYKQDLKANLGKK